LARKILLADDSVTAQNMGRKILADAGYEVIAVNNGSAALKKIAELKPDLVILDVYMPGYSGLEVCQRLKESQDTSRIPVLLSVGKLEPFKPEEAQRVRADAFIVKPFEASELLSALSKLEDRVVPRAEASKTGRFARAIAAADEADRSRDERGTDTGWKSRLGLPHAKTEPEEKVADEASIYNPINRDLRTVVEKPALDAASHKDKREDKQENQAPAENAVKQILHAVPAASSLPKDVTPEEVAAIAAVAAQIQMATALRDEPQISERQISETQPSEAASQANPEASADIDAKTSPESRDIPVTIAATAESVASGVRESRWAAVPVALDADEAVISLDREMQKAYAAFVPADANFATAADIGNSQGIASALSVSPAADASAAISNPELKPVPKPEHTFLQAIESQAIEFQPVLAPQPESAAVESSASSREAALGTEPAIAPTPQIEGASQPPITAEAATVEAKPEPSSTLESAETHHDPSPVASAPEPVSQIGDLEIPVPEARASHESEPAREQTTPPSESAFAPLAQTAEAAAYEPSPTAQYAPESKLDPETVKSTAAAWASWRQTRDTSKGSDIPAQSADTQSRELDAPKSAPPESAPAEAARAVAAGAEQILQEVSAAAPNEKAPDVASIVDSVLADLRPKLMEEISRKMAQKK